MSRKEMAEVKEGMAKVPQGKRGILFTLVSLTMVLVLIVVFSQLTPMPQRGEVDETRIRELDNTLLQIREGFFPLALHASTKQAITQVIIRVNETGIFLTDPEKDIASVVQNGSLGSMEILNKTNMRNFSSQIVARTRDVHGLELKVSVINISIAQSNPWFVDSQAVLEVSARSEMANWSPINYTVFTQIAIEGFLDVNYLKNTDGLYDKRITRSTIPQNKWNVSKFNAFVGSGNYTSFTSSGAPSFLERFRDVPQESVCCPIESVIDETLLPPDQQGQFKSHADYLFWVQSCEVNETYRIEGAPFNHTGMILDFEHAVLYNVTSHATPIAC